MADPKLSLFNVEVEFNPSAILDPVLPMFAFTVNGLITPPGELTVIPVPSGIGMIVFRLSTLGDGPGASFQTNAIQWFATDPDGLNSNNPTEAPGMFSFHRQSDTIVRLIDFNSNLSESPQETTHWFNIVVAYEGQTYGSDPSIVNEPPSPG